MKAPQKKASKVAPIDEIFVPGNPSEVLLNYAYDHYRREYNDAGEMVFYDIHKAKTLRIPEDSLYFMEILLAYEFLEG
jgi:hypothetical protein